MTFRFKEMTWQKSQVFSRLGWVNVLLPLEKLSVVHVMSLKDPFSRLSRLGWGLDIPIRETCSSLWKMSSLLVTLRPAVGMFGVKIRHLLSKKARDGPCWWPRRYSHSCQRSPCKNLQTLLLGHIVGGRARGLGARGVVFKPFIIFCFFLKTKRNIYVFFISVFCTNFIFTPPIPP